VTPSLVGGGSGSTLASGGHVCIHDPATPRPGDRRWRASLTDPTGTPLQRLPGFHHETRGRGQGILVQVRYYLFPGILSVRRPLFLILATLIAGCDQKIPESGNVPLSATPLVEGALTGTVLEHLAAPPYLYLRLKTASGEAWAAVDGGAVQKGDEVTVANAMLMKDFASTTLKRTFPEVYFGTLAPSGRVGAAPQNPHAGAGPATERIEFAKMEKATGAGARTVAETWAQRADLDGKSVTIRGLAVKVTEGVMGKNWVHLQDGSGAVSEGNFDITVTTLDKVTATDTVTVTGTVRTNRDVGAGYVYAVLIENAKVVRK